MSEPRFGAAVVQAAPVAFDVEATLAKAERLTAKAAAGGARLVVFPEAFVSCYPRGITFGAAVGSRTDEGRAWFRRYWESSVDVPGPVVDRLGAIAHEHDVYLVIGVIERDGGTLYCTAIFLYAKGIQIWCAPTADARETWIASMRHIACEGRCFVLSANQFATRADYPVDYPLDAEPDEVLCRGGSVIVSPLGEVLAGPETGGEAILHAALDLGRITEAKYDLDVVGHYARPDVFTLVVDEVPATLVEAPFGQRSNWKEEL